MSTDLHLTKALLATALHIRVRAQRQAAVRALDVLLCAQASPIAEIGSIAPGIDRLYCTTCSSLQPCVVQLSLAMSLRNHCLLVGHAYLCGRGRQLQHSVVWACQRAANAPRSRRLGVAEPGCAR